LPEAEDWCVTTFCGGEAEHNAFHDRRGDHGDLIAIDNMMQRLGLDWTDDKLADLRGQSPRP
jgi:hypothetical protein